MFFVEVAPSQVVPWVFFIITCSLLLFLTSIAITIALQKFKKGGWVGGADVLRGKADQANADVLQLAALGQSELSVWGKAHSCFWAGPCDFLWLLILNSWCVLSAWARSGMGTLRAEWRLGVVNSKRLLSGKIVQCLVYSVKSFLWGELQLTAYATGGKPQHRTWALNIFREAVKGWFCLGFPVKKSSAMGCKNAVRSSKTEWST